MQQTEAQTMGATEERIEVYNNAIEEAISQYCIDHNLDKKDLYTMDQSRWNSVLMYIYQYAFKPIDTDKRRYNENSNINYSDIELLKSVCNIYINLCYEYSKEISILGFSKLTGINPDTIYTWGKEDGLSRGTSDIYKNLSREREESLSVRLVSGKGNPVGILGILNRHYGWNMGQPRGQDSRQKAPDLPGMERKYLGSSEKPAIPKQDF